jgi:2-polyprenyl-6-methoxyphenol hydroxylase-like FAD-dependent oxidoreductase
VREEDPIPAEPEVLIVGAGPVGLACACELARRGVPARIVDKAAARSTWSKALAVHARTLEALESAGLADRFLAAGAKLRAFNAIAGGERLIHATFDDLDSPFPFVLILPQSETERLLEERLAELGGRVERGAELVGLAQEADGVTARLRGPGGAELEARARWLIGADGAHSAVRHALGLPFEGTAYEETFILADVRLEASLPRDEVHVFLAPEGVLGIFPFPEPGIARLIADVTATAAGDAEASPTLERFQRLLDERGPRGARVTEARWLSAFKFHRRLVPRYRVGRVFLAGDAAHIHSPAGGQGMNTGIQDAQNLAWKLALVAKGGGREGPLLDSYEAERRPIAAATIAATDRFTWLATLHGPLSQSVRNHLVPFLAGFDPVRRKVTRTFAELDLWYPKSPIVEKAPLLGSHAGPEPGRRSPRHAIAREQRHTLVLAPGASAPGLSAAEKLVRERYSDRVAVEEAPAEGGSGPHLYLARPDGYVAYAGPPSAERLAAYLERIFT